MSLTFVLLSSMSTTILPPSRCSSALGGRNLISRTGWPAGDDEGLERAVAHRRRFARRQRRAAGTERVEPSATGPVWAYALKEEASSSTHRHTTLMLLPAAALMAARCDAGAPMSFGLTCRRPRRVRLLSLGCRLKRYSKSSGGQGPTCPDLR